MQKIRDTLRTLYEGQSDAAHRFRYFLLAMDIATLIFVVAAPFFNGQYFLYAFQIAFIIFGLYITLDFAARVYISTERMHLLTRPHSIIDMVVILSFLLPLLYPDLAFLRVFAIFRLLRSYLVISRLRDDFEFFRRYEDTIMSATNLLIFIFAMTELVYQSQYAKNPKIDSFIDAMYFTVSTLTTTGFGDIVLEGSMGKAISVVIMIFGVSLFIRLIQTLLRPNKVRFPCPACGLYLHDRDAVHCKHCGLTLNIADEGIH